MPHIEFETATGGNPERAKELSKRAKELSKMLKEDLIEGL